jgi:cytidine deaminase
MSIQHKIEGLDWLMKIARNSPNHNRHAAGLYNRRGQLICAANNKWTSHAEHRVILRYFAVDKFRRQKISYIVVIRVTKSGNNLAISVPCNKCQSLLDELNIRVIHS